MKKFLIELDEERFREIKELLERLTETELEEEEVVNELFYLNGGREGDVDVRDSVKVSVIE